jgi:urease accessory protein
MNRPILRAAALMSALLPALAHAHPGHDIDAALLAGLVHPLSGLDHLMVIFGIGVWAAQLGGKLRRNIPVCFLSVMVLSALLAMSGYPISGVEQSIAASMLLTALLLAFSWKLPPVAGIAVAALFAAFHGLAHGAEAPAAAGRLLFIVGFATSTAAIQFAGVLVGELLLRSRRKNITTIGSIDTTMIPIVTKPKLFLMAGRLPKK